MQESLKLQHQVQIKGKEVLPSSLSLAPIVTATTENASALLHVDLLHQDKKIGAPNICGGPAATTV